MYYFRTTAIGLFVTLLTLVPALASERRPAKASSAIPTVSPLDRVAFAVDGAESSHGMDQGMWRPDPTGPEGPMQVGEAAASDVGGGDRFDLNQNREIGRSYLAQLYRRYRNWPDAIAAYNWGIGNLDAWVRAGRPADGLATEVAAYLGRVLRDSGLCRLPTGFQASDRAASCEDLRAWPALVGTGKAAAGAIPAPFYNQLDRALHLAVQRAGSR